MTTTLRWEHVPRSGQRQFFADSPHGRYTVHREKFQKHWHAYLMNRSGKFSITVVESTKEQAQAACQRDAETRAL